MSDKRPAQQPVQAYPSSGCTMSSDATHTCAVRCRAKNVCELAEPHRERNSISKNTTKPGMSSTAPPMQSHVGSDSGWKNAQNPRTCMQPFHALVVCSQPGEACLSTVQGNSPCYDGADSNERCTRTCLQWRIHHRCNRGTEDRPRELDATLFGALRVRCNAACHHIAEPSGPRFAGVGQVCPFCQVAHTLIESCTAKAHAHPVLTLCDVQIGRQVSATAKRHLTKR